MTLPASPAPLVSVVVPCFNLGVYLDEAVSSVLRQTYPHVEVVVVNDGSTDPQTCDLLRTYTRPKTRVLHTPNRGLGAARNLGIGAARGDLLCCLDADDILEPTYLEQAVRILEDRPDLTFVSSWLETFGDEQWVWRQDRCDLPTLLAECTVSTASVVRLQAVLTVGGFDEGMPAQGYEDWDLWISLVERGYVGTILPEVLFRYRRRAGSMSSICCAGETHLQLMRYLIDKHRTSYEAHFDAVVARKEQDLATQLRANDRLEREIQTAILPVLAARQEEAQRLRARLTTAEARHRPVDAEPPAQPPAAEAGRAEEYERRIQAAERQVLALESRAATLEAALQAAHADIAALRTSRSWRWMAPLRAFDDLLHGRSRSS